MAHFAGGAARIIIVRYSRPCRGHSAEPRLEASVSLQNEGCSSRGYQSSQELVEGA